jgi:hypothetical protein
LIEDGNAQLKLKIVRANVLKHLTVVYHETNIKVALLKKLIQRPIKPQEFFYFYFLKVFLLLVFLYLKVNDGKVQ